MLVAGLIGGLISGGVIAFLHSYDTFKSTTQNEQITKRFNHGVESYNNQDYATAIVEFEAARGENPTGALKLKIDASLTSSYVQEGRRSLANGNAGVARDKFNKALSVDPNSQAAHSGLAQALAQLGDTAAAKREKEAANNSTEAPPPQNLSSTPSEDPDQFLNQRREEAKQLISDGDELRAKNDIDGARARWRSAIEKAPGTPERDTAQQRLDQNEPPPQEFNGN